MRVKRRKRVKAIRNTKATAEGDAGEAVERDPHFPAAPREG